MKTLSRVTSAVSSLICPGANGMPFECGYKLNEKRGNVTLVLIECPNRHLFLAFAFRPSYRTYQHAVDQISILKAPFLQAPEQPFLDLSFCWDEDGVSVATAGCEERESHSARVDILGQADQSQ